MKNINSLEYESILTYFENWEFSDDVLQCRLRLQDLVSWETDIHPTAFRGPLTQTQAATATSAAIRLKCLRQRRQKRPGGRDQRR